jgi:hypothetical protein
MTLYRDELHGVLECANCFVLGVDGSEQWKALYHRAPGAIIAARAWDEKRARAALRRAGIKVESAS